MATIYNFSHWEVDGVAAGTNTTLSLTIVNDVDVIAVYAKDQHIITFQSTPVAVTATANGTPIASGNAVTVDHGATVTFVTPAQVTA